TQLAGQIGKRGKTSVADSVEDAMRGATGVVNGSPVGLLPNRGTPVPDLLLHKDLWVADAVYRPLWTPLVNAAKARGAAALGGRGATVGNNWKNGSDLAIEEINAKGGLLGRKLEVTHADSQSNPGIARAQVQKALDNEPYVLLGPGYSGSVKVTSPLAAEAGITQIMGGEAAELTQGGNKFLFRTSFGQQSSMPKV